MSGRTRHSRARVRSVLAAAIVGLGALAVSTSPFAATSSGTQLPAFVQQVSKRATATSVALSPAAPVVSGDRLVVEVGVWASGSPHASAVTDSAGNIYTEA